MVDNPVTVWVHGHFSVMSGLKKMLPRGWFSVVSGQQSDGNFHTPQNLEKNSGGLRDSTQANSISYDYDATGDQRFPILQNIIQTLVYT